MWIKQGNKIVNLSRVEIINYTAKDITFWFSARDTENYWVFSRQKPVTIFYMPDHIINFFGNLFSNDSDNKGE